MLTLLEARDFEVGNCETAAVWVADYDAGTACSFSRRERRIPLF